MSQPAKRLAVAGFILLIAIWGFRKVMTSPDWQNFSGKRFWASIAHLNLAYVAGGILLIYLTYLLRSLRWREFLMPVKKTRVASLLTATILGFAAIALFGRPGELIRPYLVARAEDLPVTSQLAVWVVERFFDTVAILLVVGLALAWAGAMAGGQASALLHRVEQGGVIMMAGTALGVVLMVLYERHLPTWEPWVFRKLDFLPRRISDPLRKALYSFSHGLASLRSLRAILLGGAYSVGVWLSISGCFWLTLRAFGPPVSELGPAAAMIVMGFGIVGSVVQLPGVGGGSQILTIVALTEVYDLPPEVATSAAVVLFLLTFMAVVPTAAILAVRQGLTWGKLRMMTRGLETETR